jgi:hypothetical protein
MVQCMLDSLHGAGGVSNLGAVPATFASVVRRCRARGARAAESRRCAGVEGLYAVRMLNFCPTSWAAWAAAPARCTVTTLERSPSTSRRFCPPGWVLALAKVEKSFRFVRVVGRQLLYADGVTTLAANSST